MNVLLLALTGMGNHVLEALCACRTQRDLLVITRAETGPFPHYSCEPLARACRNHGVRCLEGADLRHPDTVAALRAFAPYVALAATFHQIVSPQVLALCPGRFYNIHPSLLPAYKGPMPTNWAIIHGERTTGVTVHEMTPDIDGGRIVLRHALEIGSDCDGELRRRAGLAAGHLASELLERVVARTLKPREQTGPGSRHPRLTSPEGLRLVAGGGFDAHNIRRGATPWPGADVLARLIRERGS